MPFELQTESDIASELRRMAAEQAHHGLRSLEQGMEHPADQVDLHDEDPWDEAVHDARKRCKKVRAIARLGRDAMGDGYAEANAAFRDTARLMSDARDAWTVIETVDELAAADLDVLADGDLQAVRAPLVQRYTALRGRAVEADLLGRAHAAMTDAATGIADWPLPPDLSAADLRDSIARVRQRGLDRWDELRGHLDEDPSATTEAAHQMRKRVKYLRYQMEVLEAAWPAAMQAQAGVLDDLGSRLGDDHDLAVLCQLLREGSAAAGSAGGTPLVGPALAAKVIEAASLRRHEIRRDVAVLASRAYAEATDAFADRITTYLELQLAQVRRPVARLR